MSKFLPIIANNLGFKSLLYSEGQLIWNTSEKRLYVDANNKRNEVSPVEYYGDKFYELSTLESIPVSSGIIYKYNLQGDELISFQLPKSGYSPTFELWLFMPDTTVSFSFITNILWADSNGDFIIGNLPPDFLETNCIYRLVFQWNGTTWLGNLSGVEYLTGE